MNIINLLDALPELPISPELSYLLAAFVVSLGAAGIVLIRNRRLLKKDIDTESNLGAVFANPGGLLPHIVELRSRLVNGLIAIAVGTVVATIMGESILVLLADPVGGLEALQAIRVTEPFGVFFRTSLTIGVILASPYVIAQLWVFVATGLRHTERRIFYLLVPFAVVLFTSGVAFAYFVMLPIAVPFLVTFMGMNATPTLEDYVKFITSVLLWVGISFEMPLVMFALAKAGLVNARMLLTNWRVAVVAIAVLSAVVTPTPDPINMGIVAAPLFVLYLLSILLCLFA